jgi:hypothetical protein
MSHPARPPCGHCGNCERAGLQARLDITEEYQKIHQVLVECQQDEKFNGIPPTALADVLTDSLNSKSGSKWASLKSLGCGKDLHPSALWWRTIIEQLLFQFRNRLLNYTWVEAGQRGFCAIVLPEHVEAHNSVSLRVTLSIQAANMADTKKTKHKTKKRSRNLSSHQRETKKCGKYISYEAGKEHPYKACVRAEVPGNTRKKTIAIGYFRTEAEALQAQMEWYARFVYES